MTEKHGISPLRLQRNFCSECQRRINAKQRPQGICKKCEIKKENRPPCLQCGGTAKFYKTKPFTGTKAGPFCSFKCSKVYNYPTIPCTGCGKPIVRYRGRLDGGPQFCTNRCEGDHRRKSAPGIICPHCGGDKGIGRSNSATCGKSECVDDAKALARQRFEERFPQDPWSIRIRQQRSKVLTAIKPVDPWKRRCQNAVVALRIRQKRQPRTQPKPARKVKWMSWEQAAKREMTRLRAKYKRQTASAWMKKCVSTVNNLGKRRRALKT